MPRRCQHSRCVCVYASPFQPFVPSNPQSYSSCVNRNIAMLTDDDCDMSSGGATTAAGNDEYGSINGGVIPLLDEECPPHDDQHGHNSNVDQQIDEMALSIVLETIEASPSVTTQDFFEAVQEEVTSVAFSGQNSHDYSLPVERIRAMLLKEKVECQQDWEGGLIGIAIAGTSTATDGGTHSDSLRGGDEDHYEYAYQLYYEIILEYYKWKQQCSLGADIDGRGR